MGAFKKELFIAKEVISGEAGINGNRLGIAPSRTPVVEASEAHLTECVGV